MEQNTHTQPATELDGIDQDLRDRAEELAELIGGNPFRTRLPDGLEWSYRGAYFDRHADQIRFAVLVGLVLYLAFGLFDLAMGMLTDTVRDEAERPSLLVAVAPFLVACILLPGLLYLSYRPFFARWHQALISAGALLAGAGGLSLASAYSPPVSYLQICAIVLVMWWVYSVSGLRLPIAIGIGLVLSVSGLAVMHLELGAAPIITTYVALLFAAANVLGALISFGTACLDRRSYLQELLTDIERRLMQKLSDRLRVLSKEDPLTGLSNRRSFDEELELEWRRALRRRDPLALISIDIDEFKRFNDRYGHQAGDAALRRTAAALRDVARRPGDLVARYGGEEFLILLTAADTSTARRIAENLCRTIAAMRIPHDASGVAAHLTVSAGYLARIPSEDGSPERLIADTDHQLYRAKSLGRDRAVGPDTKES